MRDTTIQAYPLQWPDGWPRTRYPLRSRYGGGRTLKLARCIEEVEEEIRKLIDRRTLSTNDLVISTNMRRRKVDGGIYANEREPGDSGVAVYFRKDGEQRVIANDKWRTVAENLHAIALTIDRLRGLERDGSSEILKRAFRGFDALPDPSAVTRWWEVLGVSAHIPTNEIPSAYRAAVKRAHPDQGGTEREFHEVHQAYETAMKERGIA